ncbi:MAG: hypothetical protein ICV86_06415 [Microcoleus sp. T3-bin5]|nr:hypothetical protein [Microcoleus sp. T3-bin5]
MGESANLAIGRFIRSSVDAIGQFMRSGDLSDRAIDKFAVGKRHRAVSSMPSPHKIYLADPICRETAPRRVLNPFFSQNIAGRPYL